MMIAKYAKRLVGSAAAGAFAGLLLYATAGFAEPPAQRPAALPVLAPAPAPTTSYSFEDEAVLGDTSQPSGEVLLVRPRKERGSLVRAREHFVAELLKSVESL